MGERDVRLLDERIERMEREICNMMTLIHQEHAKRLDIIDQRVYNLNEQLASLKGKVKTIGAIAGTVTAAVISAVVKLVQGHVK